MWVNAIWFWTRGFCACKPKLRVNRVCTKRKWLYAYLLYGGQFSLSLHLAPGLVASSTPRMAMHNVPAKARLQVHHHDIQSDRVSWHIFPVHSIQWLQSEAKASLICSSPFNLPERLEKRLIGLLNLQISYCQAFASYQAPHCRVRIAIHDAKGFSSAKCKTSGRIGDTFTACPNGLPVASKTTTCQTVKQIPEPPLIHLSLWFSISS